MSIFIDPKARLNLHPHYEKLRREGPVHFEESIGAWLILPYATVRRAFGEPSVFSNRYGLERAFQGVVKGNIMVGVDPPEHTRLRSIVSHAFTPRMVAALEPNLYTIVNGLVDRVIASGEMDVVEDLAGPFPFMVIAKLLGVSLSDWTLLRGWLHCIQLSAAAVALQQEQSNLRAELSGLLEYLRKILEDRRREPRDDLLSLLVRAESGGDRLDEDDLVAFAVLLLVGGMDTTCTIIGQAVRTLLSHPDAMERLRRDRSLLPTAMEEILRFEPSAHFVPRVVARDVEIGGKQLKRGDRAQLVVAAANRDEAVFEDPNRFDITRDPNPHLSFGHGIHFCMGSAIGRMELRVALSVLLDRCVDLARADDSPFEPSDVFHLNGLKSLRVRFRPGKIVGGSG